MHTRTRQTLKLMRRWHRIIGINLAVLWILIGLSGILLAWKKQSDWLQPPTQRANTAAHARLLSLPQIMQQAQAAAQKQYPAKAFTIDRVDFRPDKGIAKVRFESHQLEVQVNAYTGNIASVARRHADWIEALHDLSIAGPQVKLIAMTLGGLGLVFLAVSGFWLWMAPKRIKKYSINRR